MSAKLVLVTGCSGLVGTFLLNELLRDNYKYKVVGVDIKKPEINFNQIYSDRFIFHQLDLTKDGVIEKLFMDYGFESVINTFGIKGSPIRAKTKPVDFLYPSIKINTEIINQCSKRDIHLIYLSSVGVYAPSEKFIEDDVWKTLPSENDWFPSWSKRFGELLLDAYKVQYGYEKWTILRPANIFGDFDDYSGNGTVISSTIKKIKESSDYIECWGDGSPIRDFVYGKDVAFAIKKILEEKIYDTLNFGSGVEISIKSMIENLVKISGKNLEIRWDTSKPNGDLRRQMDTTKQKKYDLLPKTNFYDALKMTYYYYMTQFPIEGLNFNVREFLTNGGYYSGKLSEIIEDTDELERVVKLVYDTAKDKSKFGYRFDFRFDLKTYFENSFQTKLHYTTEEIPIVEEYINKNKGYEVQRWWDLNSRDEKSSIAIDFFQKNIENYVGKIYPNLMGCFDHQDGISLFENGDFIEPHNDGENRNRYCVVIIYLSDKKDYNNGGGELKIMENGKEEYISPLLGNFAILDFTLNNPNHSVEKVKNNFERITYINFIHNKKLIGENIS